MLMVFEGMQCKQRLASLGMLREMRRPPIRLFVFRNNAWELLSSDLLVPGDIISLCSDSAAVAAAVKATSGKRPSKRDEVTIAKSQDRDHLVPCDALLLRGSCVVNEAMLTGESVPQIKETLENADDVNASVQISDDNVDAQWKRHLVFSGTSLLQHSETVSTPNSDAEQSKGAAGKYPRPPDRGCTAVVIRTGFATSQGGLMRKILFATERITANSSETFYFIGVLVIFAVIASAVVLEEGLRDDTRNRFKLVLHCIMIITSVVPPELPMELSLAVTNSLQALSRDLVFCTEPFRIPLAGKLDVLCFDKTGTLTQDQMYLRGVVAGQTPVAFLSSLAGSITKKRVSAVVDDTTKSAADGADEGDEIPVATTSSSSSSTAVGTTKTKTSAVVAVDEPADSADLVVSVMASCHALFQSNGQIQGDPMEVATMETTNFVFESASVVANKKRNIRLRIHHKYPFSSALKRMSVLVEAEAMSKQVLSSEQQNPSSAGEVFLFTKGAPEILAAMLVSIPPFYTATYMYHMSKGRRVIALACRRFGSNSQGDQAAVLLATARVTSRQELEKELHFVGFLVFDCDLKPDSKSVMKELRQAGHTVLMITGDSAFTAAEVGRKLAMTKPAGVKILQPTSERDKDGMKSDITAGTAEVAEWIAVTKASSDAAASSSEPFSLSQLGLLANTYSLCVTGSALLALEQSAGSTRAWLSILRQICPHVTIFARVSPAQKEVILQALNDSGHFTLMCGDGTNDVGALKAAHVGVSIVNDPELERRVNAQEQGDKKKLSAAKSRLNRALAELQEQEQDPTIVKLGDASIASPFTARRTSIDCVLAVLRQGRCTLVTTIQVFKILALNCLVSAYMMSALYLRGLKQGDTQMTITGLATAGLFFFLSQAKSLPKLSSHKPPSTVFAKSVLISIAGQFLVHLCSLIGTLYMCEVFSPSDQLSGSPDGRFRPNLVNSAVYMLSSIMQINNFIVNYRGHPFTQSIQENTSLWRSVLVVYGVLFVACTEALEPLNDLLQLAKFPSAEFRSCLICILALNFGLTWTIEKTCHRFE